MSERDPIPREFYSEYTELPFAHCIDCECPLFESETLYTVLKHIVGGETVFEMAICLSCAEKLRAQYSTETTQRLQAFLEEKLKEKLLQRLEQENSEPDSFTVQDGIASCSFCGKPQADCHRYEIVGLFMENEILLDSGFGISFSSPMMLCEDCNSEVSNLISQKTRDSWDRFVQDHFDGPPGIELDSPNVEPVLF